MKRILIILLSAGLLTSCGWGTASAPRMQVNPQCAEVRLESAFDYHNQAKDFFRSFYKTRKENELFFAWYSTEDSIYMANSIKRCYDKKNKHYNAVKNLYNKNSTLQRLIVQNMRQESQSKLSELYLEDYREIFVRDIQ
ncbi:MAG: hypothetical protein HQ517_01410 [SAR324 cluster bacterium]|nr:hypothetical protein [SAR324 cluster bacterium]